VIQAALGVVGVALLAMWVGEHPLLRALLEQISAVWVVGVGAKVLASKWLTEVVVTDQLLSLLHQGRESAQSLADTAEREALARKLDALGHSPQPPEPKKGSPG
jgi:hypothetical protein